MKHMRRKIAEEAFEYGEHAVRVLVRIRHTNAYYNIGHDIMSGPDGYAYWRTVDVSAVRDGTREFGHESYVNLEADDRPRRTVGVPFLGEVVLDEGRSKPSIREQVEHTLEPVLVELDDLYEITMRDREVEVEVAMEWARQSESWADVEAAADEISRELGMGADA
jgi:hypothetical protein